MIVEAFMRLYQELDASNLDRIESVYAPEIVFCDPFHEVRGLQALKAYFRKLYQNVDSISFTFGDVISDQDSYFVQWTMVLKHPKLNRNQPSEIVGATFFKVNQHGKIRFHRDYFDAGSMLYEKVPVVGGIIRWIKGQV